MIIKNTLMKLFYEAKSCRFNVVDDKISVTNQIKVGERNCEKNPGDSSLLRQF